MRHLVIAALICAALYFVPYLGFVTYPLRLLVTFIHEGSHALMTVLTGGAVTSLTISADGSGLTKSLGGFGLLVSPAGYLGATLYGALLVAALRRGVSGRALLMVTGVIVGLLTLCFGHFGTNPSDFLLTTISGVGLTVALILGGLRLSEHTAGFAAAFIGIQCILNALFDLRTLFELSVSTNAATDAQNMASMTLLPAVFWSVLWLGTAGVILWSVVLRPALREARTAAIG